MPGDAVLHRDRAGGDEPVAVSVWGHKYPEGDSMDELKANVSELTDEEVMVVWKALVRGYLILPPSSSPSVLQIYLLARAAFASPAVVLVQGGNPYQRLISACHDQEIFSNQLSFVIESGAFVDVIVSPRKLFAAWVRSERAEALAKSLSVAWHLRQADSRGRLIAAARQQG